MSAGLLESTDQKIYFSFVWVEPGIYAALPKGKQDNTHLNVRGARLIARMVAEAIKETIPALAPHIVMYDYVVAKDGSGDFLLYKRPLMQYLISGKRAYDDLYTGRRL